MFCLQYAIEPLTTLPTEMEERMAALEARLSSLKDAENASLRLHVDEAHATIETLLADDASEAPSHACEISSHASHDVEDISTSDASTDDAVSRVISLMPSASLSLRDKELTLSTLAVTTSSRSTRLRSSASFVPGSLHYQLALARNTPFCSSASRLRTANGRSYCVTERSIIRAPMCILLTACSPATCPMRWSRIHPPCARYAGGLKVGFVRERTTFYYVKCFFMFTFYYENQHKVTEK